MLLVASSVSWWGYSHTVEKRGFYEQLQHNIHHLEILQKSIDDALLLQGGSVTLREVRSNITIYQKSLSGLEHDHDDPHFPETTYTTLNKHWDEYQSQIEELLNLDDVASDNEDALFLFLDLRERHNLIVDKLSGLRDQAHLDAKSSNANTQRLFVFAVLAVVLGFVALVRHLYRVITRNTQSLLNAKEKAENAEERFRDYSQSASDWFWEMDADLRFSYFSGRLEKVSGFNPNDLLGKTRRDLNVSGVDEEQWEDHYATLDRHEPFRDFEYSVSKDSETVWIEINGQPIFDNDGVFLGYRGTGANITERKLTEEKLEEQSVAMTKLAEEQGVLKDRAESADRSKSEFLASMSHEIRTPMTGVMGFADMLLEDNLPLKSKEKVYNIKDATNSLLRIINDILDVSKIEAGKLIIESLDFHFLSIVDDVLALFEEKRKGDRAQSLTFETSFSDDFPINLHSDPTRLRQILVNLIGNAVKFTEVGGVTIEGSLRQSDDGEKFIHIAVNDTGIGLKPEVIDVLFSKFTQADASISRKYEGTGLGLSISKRLVELMGGEIGVESEYGKGSTFWFTLPYIPATTEVSATPKATIRTVSKFQSVRPLHVLIADDNGLNQQIISSVMSSLGHTFDVAEEGMEAFLMHEDGNYDFILMDVRMPVLSGPDATSLIRKMEGDKSNIPIIALTADAMEENKAGYYEAGMDAVATKPIHIEELALTINKVMGENIHVAIEVEVKDNNADKPEITNAEPDPDIDDFLAQMQSAADKHDVEIS